MLPHRSGLPASGAHEEVYSAAEPASHRVEPIAVRALREELRKRGLKLIRARSLYLAVALALGLRQSGRATDSLTTRLRDAVQQEGAAAQTELHQILSALQCNAHVYDASQIASDGQFPEEIEVVTDGVKLQLAAIHGDVVGACAQLTAEQVAMVHSKAPFFFSELTAMRGP